MWQWKDFSWLKRLLNRQDHLLKPICFKEEVGKGRSLFLRHLDCGSCNGCELELTALTNPIYDLEQYGIKFVSSPRHADVLMMTGVFTRNLATAAQLTLEAMPTPMVIRVGNCAVKDGDIFKETYAVTDLPPEIRKAIIADIPGCPPTPLDILKALFKINPFFSQK